MKTEIIVRPDHETGKKPLGDLYSKFKAQYKIPENLLKLVIDDIPLNIFYSKEERDDYIKKWSTTVTLPFVGFTQNEYALYHSLSVENSLYMKVKYDHYLDNGCVCEACSKRRFASKMSIKNGVREIVRIVHVPPKYRSIKSLKSLNTLSR